MIIPYLFLFMALLWLVAGVYNFIKLDKVATATMNKMEKKASKKGKTVRITKEILMKKIKRQSVFQVFLGLLVLILVIPQFGLGIVANREVTLVQGDAKKGAKYEEKINEFLNQKKAPGFVVAIVDGDESYLYTAGRENHKNSAGKVTSTTVFEIGSITKVFTAMLLAESIESGTIQINDTVATYIEEVDTEGSSFREITMEELTTHTSGLPRLPKSVGFFLKTILTGISGSNPYEGIDKDKMLGFMDKNYNTSNDSWSYSNFGVGILGMCLTEANNQSYEELLTERITEPLGMDNTTVLDDNNNIDSYAKGYSSYLQIGNLAITFKSDPWLMDEGLVAAGGIRSTGEDMLKFLECVVAGETSFVELTKTPILEIDNEWDSGMNWIIDHSESDVVIWHNGETGGFRSYIATIEGTDKGVFIVVNSKANVDEFGEELLKLLK